MWCWGENYGFTCPHSEDFLTAFTPVKADLVSCMTRIHVSGNLAVGQHASGAWLAWGVALPEYLPGGDEAWLVRLELGEDVVDVQSLGGPFLTLNREGRVFWHEKGVRRQVPLSGPAKSIQQGTFLPCALPSACEATAGSSGRSRPTGRCGRRAWGSRRFTGCAGRRR